MPVRNNQQFARQLEARVLRDRLLAAGWPEEAFDYPTFVRRCSERQCVAYKSGIGDVARLFGIRQAERIFKCHSTTALFFRDKAERVEDKDVFEIPKDLVEQTREGVKLEQTRLPSAPPDPLLARLQEQFQQLVAQQQERHEEEMSRIQEGQQKQQEQHEKEMRQLQDMQRQQQEQHEREMRKLQEMFERREKQAPQEASQSTTPQLSEERRNAIEKFVQESCRAWMLMERMEREGRDETPLEPKLHAEEGTIPFLRLLSLYQQWEGSRFGKKGLVGFDQCALYSLYNLEVLQQMGRCKRLSKLLQDTTSTRSVPKEFANTVGIKGPLQKLANRKQFCDYLRPMAEKHATNVLNRLYLASSEEESDSGGLYHENLPFELGAADIYDLGERPPILDENLRLSNLDTYGAQYRDLEANVQKLNTSPTFAFLLRYDGQDKIPHYVAVLHVWIDRTRRACLVVDSLCGETWKKALQRVLVALESPRNA